MTNAQLHIRAAEFENIMNDVMEEISAEFGANSSALNRIRESLISLNDIRLELAPNAETPTTASGEPGELDLPSVSVRVDPSGLSLSLPNIMRQLVSINAVAGGNTQSSRNNTIYDSLTGALRILIQRYSFSLVVREIRIALKDGGIDLIDLNFRNIVRGSLANIIKDLNQYGPDNIPVSQYRKLTPEDFINIPENVVDVIPDLYVQKYKLYEEDLYPGYEEWYLRSSGHTVYLKKPEDGFYYESLQEDIYGTSEYNIANALDPYILSEEPEYELSPEALNVILRDEETFIKNTTMDKGAGNGASNGGDNLLQLLGYLASSVNLQVQVQLPQSVLNVTEIQEAMDEFTENMAMIRNLNTLVDEALQLPSAVDDLLEIPLNSIVASVGLESILTNLGVEFSSLGVEQLSGAINYIENLSSEISEEFRDAVETINNVNGIILEIS